MPNLTSGHLVLIIKHGRPESYLGRRWYLAMLDCLCDAHLMFVVRVAGLTLSLLNSAKRPRPLLSFIELG